MATTEELLIKLKADNTDLRNKLSQSGKDVQGFQGQIQKLGGMAKLAYAAIGAAVGAFARESFLAYEVQEKANRRLLFALKGNETAFKTLTIQAGYFQSKVGIPDDAIQQIQMLAAQSGKTTQEIKRITEATIQLASVTGQDLQASYLQINQTLAGNAGRLGRIDVAFANLTETQLKNGEAIDLILEKYKGFAENSAMATQKLSANWDEFKENVGGWLSKIFLPQLEKMNNIMSGSTDKFSVLGKGIKYYDLSGKFKPEVNEEVSQTDLAYWTDTYDKLVEDDKKRLDLLKQQAEEYEKMMRLETEKRDSYPDLFLPTFDQATKRDIAPAQMTGMTSSLTSGGYTTNKNSNPLDNLQTWSTAIMKVRQGQSSLAGAVESTNKAMSEQFTTLQSTAMLMEGMGQIAQDSFGEESAAYKAFAIAQAIISTYLAATSALAPPPVGYGPVAGIPAAIGIVGMGLANVGKIAGAFADGGIVGGSSFSGDSMLARVNSSEMILNASQQAQLFAMANGQAGGGTLVTKISANDLYFMVKRGEYLAGRNGRR